MRPPTPHRELLDAGVLSRLARIPLHARHPMLGSVTGAHRSATRGSSVEFAEYRKYVAGDDTKHVDWRVFARTDRFYMKEFEADTNLRCTLALDVSGSMAFGARHGSRLDLARRLAAHLAFLLTRQGDAVGLSLFGGTRAVDIPPRRSGAHLRHVLDTLTAVKAGGRGDLVEGLHRIADRTPRRGLVIVLSDLFAEIEPLLDSFQHMRFQKHDLAVFHLLDPLEIDFDFDRPIRFVDLEGSDRLITDPAVVAEGYRRAFRTWLEALTRGSREFGADYQLVRAGEPLERVLSAFLLRRTRTGAGGGR